MMVLYVVGLCFGVLTVFFDIAYQAFLPAIVERRQIVEGNSSLEASRSVAGLAGPSLAGIIIQALTAPIAILVDALSFLSSGSFISRIRKHEHVEQVKSRVPMLREVRGGLGIILGSRILRSLAGCGATGNFFGSARMALLILFLTHELGLGPAMIGVLFRS